MIEGRCRDGDGNDHVVGQGNSFASARVILSRGRNKGAVSPKCTAAPACEAKSSTHIDGALRRRLAPSPTCHAAARWFPRKWDVAVSTANLAEWCQPSVRREGSVITSTLADQHDDQITRRGIILGVAASLICAPAIVRVTNLMPVRRLPFPFGSQSAGFIERLYLHALESHMRDLRGDQTSTLFSGKIMDVANIRRRVAYAQAHGFLPPYVCIYRID
jgi:hypothetical protein